AFATAAEDPLLRVGHRAGAARLPRRAAFARVAAGGGGALAGEAAQPLAVDRLRRGAPGGVGADRVRAVLRPRGAAGAGGGRQDRPVGRAHLGCALLLLE